MKYVLYYLVLDEIGCGDMCALVQFDLWLIVESLNKLSDFIQGGSTEKGYFEK